MLIYSIILHSSITSFKTGLNCSTQSSRAEDTSIKNDFINEKNLEFCLFLEFVILYLFIDSSSNGPNVSYIVR